MARSIVATVVPAVPDGVTFEDRGDRLRLVADQDLDGVASRIFADPTIAVSFEPVGLADREVTYLGLSFGQFALPVRGGPQTPFDWNPAANVHSPPAVLPLVIRAADGTVALLAPLDSWHDQIIAVDGDETGVRGFRWGWHGDLDRIPAGTVATLGIYEAGSVTEAFGRWRADLATRPNGLPVRPPDPVTTHLSYWTDNGAAYWYRTEPGRDLPTTLADKLAELDDLGVPVRSVELDSWFYPHEISRPVTEVGYLDEVPPTGMLEWSPRPDVLPDGVADLRQRLGDRPLTLHARHISASSPYLKEDPADAEWWVDLGAHPADPAFFERWAADAASWGATCIEQDWMLLVWFGVGQLRAEPGRALAWQRGLDRAAADHGLTLLWCMPTPGDLLATVELDRICAVRTCDDYRYAEDPARLWRWYLTVNRVAATLDLPVSKDCFFTNADASTGDLDGDPHAQVEAVLSALSAGVVGIGDRIGRTDPDLVARLCRPDGVLVQPDHALALTDRSFFDTDADPVPTWAETSTTNEAGHWRYLLAVHAAGTEEPVSGSFPLDGPAVVYDWRRGTAEVVARIEVELARRDWALFVCCPLPETMADGRALIGDPAMLATMGPSRVTVTADGRVEAVLAPGEDPVPIRFWDPEHGIQDEVLS
ncbi:MAG: hypothetical protein AAFO29_08075 [Actinomycetota bacterium]